MEDVGTSPILYTQVGCADSLRVRDWLITHDVSFVERDVTVVPDAAMGLYRTGTFATLLVVGVTRVLGFRLAKIAVASGPRGSGTGAGEPGAG